LEEVFTFCYDGDVMVYLHDTRYSREFGDGSGVYFDDLTDDAPPYVFKQGDASFKVYTRESPHPYADAQILFYVSGYISGSTERAVEDGSVIYEYQYDVDGINKQLGSSFTELFTQYVFDSDGRFAYFLHTYLSLVGENGEDLRGYARMVEIREINAISGIDNPFD
jgi:hypothetical protein